MDPSADPRRRRPDAERNRDRILVAALYAEEVDDLCDAAGRMSDSPGEALVAWLRRFALFHHDKHPIAAPLLRHTVFGSSRDRVLAAGRPLLLTAQQARQIRADLALDQVLDLVLAAATIRGEPAYVEPILQAALDGLRR